MAGPADRKGLCGGTGCWRQGCRHIGTRRTCSRCAGHVEEKRMIGPQGSKIATGSSQFARRDLARLDRLPIGLRWILERGPLERVFGGSVPPTSCLQSKHPVHRVSASGFVTAERDRDDENSRLVREIAEDRFVLRSKMVRPGGRKDCGPGWQTFPRWLPLGDIIRFSF
jgi:hypothetical protein